VGRSVCDFKLVQHEQDLAAGEMLVIEKGHEVLEGTNEVNVVFPERIVGIEDEVLMVVSLDHDLASLKWWLERVGVQA
jgi:hypothetical protein